MKPDPTIDSEMLAQFEAGAEQARADLARKLHDELGGFLVAAVMDAAWAEQNLDCTEEARMRLKRARKSLAAAVDLKRGMIEQLRPTLLDTFGLLAALRWHHKTICDAASLAHTEDLPAEEAPLSAAASITVFRIVQEALAMAVRQPAATSVHLSLALVSDALRVVIRHDGERVPAAQRRALDSLSFWLIENRVKALGGALGVTGEEHPGVELVVTIPSINILTVNKRVSAG